MRDGPWRWRRGARRYNPAMTTLMNAALPANTTLVPNSPDAAGLPAGLTDIDVARIAAAIAAARTESTRTVYAQAWSQWER